MTDSCLQAKTIAEVVAVVTAAQEAALLTTAEAM